MNNKRGFTLVELLAVIAILAILVIIALPNVMGMFNQAKKNSFMTEVKTIYKVAQQQWMNDSMFSTGQREYGRCDGCSYKELELSGRNEIKYYIKINQAGKIVKYIANDGTYQFSYNGEGLDITDITDNKVVASTTSELQIKDYLYSVGYISVNSSTPSSISSKYSNYQDALNASRGNFFLRGEVENDIIVTVDIGFVVNSSVYYLKTRDGFEENKNLLLNELGLICNVEGGKLTCGSPAGTIVLQSTGNIIQSSDYLCLAGASVAYCRID